MSGITIPARPQALVLDPARTALLVIDMQNDFASEGGMFSERGIPLETIGRVVAPIAATVDAVRKAGIPVVFLKMGFAPDLSDAGPPSAPNRIKHARLRAGEPSASGNGRVLVRGDWGTDIVPALAPLPNEAQVWKTRYSGFFETELDAHLRALAVDTLIVTGCTTSVCVDSTVRDAMFRDYRCLVLEDCVAEPIAHDASRSNHAASLLIFEILLAWVGASRDLIRALEA